MAGYSSTPLPQKLGLKPGLRACFVDAPPAFAVALGSLPEGVELVTARAATVDVCVLFVTRAAALAGAFARRAAKTPPAGAIWLGWPKRGSGIATDITEDVLRAVLLPTGWVDVKVCAIDAQWSGLKFVRRLASR